MHVCGTRGRWVKYWNPNKMANILHMTLSVHSFVFWFLYLWSLFWKVQLTVIHHSYSSLYQAMVCQQTDDKLLPEPMMTLSTHTLPGLDGPVHWWIQGWNQHRPHQQKNALFYKGTHICLMASLIIMFPRHPIWFQDPILKIPSSNPVHICTTWQQWVNTLAPGQCGTNFKSIISKCT